MEAIFIKSLNLWAGVIFSLLSLFCTFILFKFLKSTAIIKNTKYKAGGAIAGFVILFAALTAFYDSKTSDELNKLREENSLLQEKLKESPINGVFTPATEEAENNKIVLVVAETQPDMRGRFKLVASCIDPKKDDVKLYILSNHGSGYKNVSFASKDEMTNVEIPTKKDNK